MLEILFIIIVSILAVYGAVRAIEDFIHISSVSASRIVIDEEPNNNPNAILILAVKDCEQQIEAIINTIKHSGLPENPLLQGGLIIADCGSNDDTVKIAQKAIEDTQSMQIIKARK